MINSKWINERNKRAHESVLAATRAIGERAGIIKHISDLMIEPDDPLVFDAVTHVTNTFRLHGNMSSANYSGAGLTREMARASAIGETFERYCCAIYEQRNLIKSSYTDLQRRGVKAIFPHDFALFSDQQYAHPNFIFQRFTEDLEISWTQGYSLGKEEPMLVPACLVYVPYRYDLQEDLIAFGVTTGVCCARSLPEAILGGLYEAIERDAIMIMWMNRLSRPRISPFSGSWLPVILQERFMPSGLKFYLNDITTDMPIPVVFALIVDEYNDGLAVAAGASANLDPEAAALKALMEAAQGRSWLKSLKERKVNRTYREDFSDVVNFDDHVLLFGSLTSISFAEFLVQTPLEKDVLAIPTLGTTNTIQDLKRCIDVIIARGLDIVVVNLTQPDVGELGFYVVKVLIPGLIDINANHNYTLLGGERLYTIPHILGYVDRNTQEEEMNRIPHPFP